MPDPYLRSLPRLGGRTSRGLIRTRAQAQEPFRPTPEEIDAAGQEIEEEDDSNLLFDLLRIPSRLLGGELIKGVLKDIGNDASIEEIGQTILEDNPLTQAASLLIPGADFAGETDFSEIRDTGLFGDALDFENPVGQFLVDLAGEIVTSPLELLWTPFGKVGPALRSSKVAVSADLGKAVEAGAKAMMAFKIPYTRTGFHVPLPKNLDYPIARAIQGTADWLNTQPLTARFFQLFNNNQAMLRDAEQRAGVAEALEKKFITFRETHLDGVVAFGRVVDRTPDSVKNNPEAGLMAMQIIENGLDATDEAADVFRKLEDKIARPPKQPTTFDRSIDEVLLDAEPDPFGGSAGFSTDPGDIGTGTTEARALASGQVETAGSEIAREKTQELSDAFRQLWDTDRDQAESVLEFAKGMKSVLKDLGEGDVINGVLRSFTEPYFPRVINPDVRNAIQKQWSKFDKQRQFFDLTTVEINELAAREGLKLTNFQTIDEAVKEHGTGTMQFLMSKVFPEDWVNALSRMGPEGREAAELFMTNPVDAVMRRIQSSAEKRSWRDFEKFIIEDPRFAADATTVRKVLTDPATQAKIQEHAAQGRTAYLVREVEKDGLGNVMEINEEGIDGLYQRILLGDVDAKHQVGLRQFSDSIDELLSTGRATAEEVLGDLRDLRDLGLGDKALLKQSKTLGDPQKVTGNTGQRIRALQKRLDHLETTRWAKHPYAENLRNQKIMLESWDDVDSWGMVPWERDLLKDRNPLQAIDQARGNLQARRDELHSAIGDLRIEEKRLITSRKRLEKSLKNITSRRFGEESAADINEALARVEYQLSEVKDRIARDMKFRDRLDGQIKETGKGKRASQKFLKDLEARGRSIQKRRFDALEAAEKEHKANILGAISRYEEEYNLFAGTLKSKKREGLRKVGEAARSERKSIEGSTSRLNDLMRVYRAHRESGILAMDDLQKNYPEVAESILNKSGDAKVVFIDRAVHDEILDPRAGMRARITAPDAWATELKTFDRMTSSFKAWTVLPPVLLQRFARDFVSNVWMQGQGGVNPGLMAAQGAEAARFVGKLGTYLKKNFDPSVFDDYVMDPKVLSAMGIEATGREAVEEAFRVMYSRGVVNHSLWQDAGFMRAAQDIQIISNRTGKDPQTLGGKLWNELYDKRLASFGDTVIQKGAQFAEYVDAVPKVAAFFGHLKMGKSLDEAAQTVKAWGYDPRLTDMSAFERNTLRRFIPFYSWMKKAVTSQAELLVTKPGALAPFEKAHREAGKLAGLSDIEYEMVLPEYIRDGLGIPVDVAPDGTARVMMFGEMLPLGTVAKIADAIQDTFDPDAKGHIGQFIAAQSNPWIKVPVETAVNRSAFSQREIELYEGERVEYLGVQMPPRVRHLLMSVRLLNEVDRLNVLDISQVGAILGMEDKDLGLLLQPEVRTTGAPSTAADRLFFGGSGLSPFPAKFYSRDLNEDIQRAINRKQFEANRTVSMGKREMEQQAEGGAAAESNIQALRKVLSRKIAEKQALERLQRERQGGR